MITLAPRNKSGRVPINCLCGGRLPALQDFTGDALEPGSFPEWRLDRFAVDDDAIHVKNEGFER
jgi:hypothetical protein